MGYTVKPCLPEHLRTKGTSDNCKIQINGASDFCCNYSRLGPYKASVRKCFPNDFEMAMAIKQTYKKMPPNTLIDIIVVTDDITDSFVDFNNPEILFPEFKPRVSRITNALKFEHSKCVQMLKNSHNLERYILVNFA